MVREASIFDACRALMKEREKKKQGKKNIASLFLTLHLIWWKQGPVQSTIAVSTIIILQFVHIRTWC